MGNMRRSTFFYVFLVAALLAKFELLLGCRSATDSWNHDIGRLHIPLADPGDMCHVNKISSPGITAYTRDQPWMTSTHVTLQEDLKVKPASFHSSGQRCSEMGNMLRSTFFYAFQIVLAVCAAFLLPFAATGVLRGGGPDLTLHKDQYGRFGISIRYDHMGYGYMPLGRYGGGYRSGH
ncbi:uncharacterized protein [Dermacentor albipictus]|uniref:uncharacterized protein n=1 Tax=Dermacentor albipictus TaxID=60249 RepID=UPI0038FCBCA4